MRGGFPRSESSCIHLSGLQEPGFGSLRDFSEIHTKGLSMVGISQECYFLLWEAFQILKYLVHSSYISLSSTLTVQGFCTSLSGFGIVGFGTRTIVWTIPTAIVQTMECWAVLKLGLMGADLSGRFVGIGACFV